MKTQAEDRLGMGSEGFCVCPKCGVKILHRVGMPFRDETCLTEETIPVSITH